MLDEVGITFAFAALFHPGFKHAGPTRAELGIPTVFNFLGPLCNPARPEASALGVAQLDKVPLFVGVFQTRGATALVFRGDDGLDELSTTGHSHVWEISRGEVHEHDLDPGDLGLPRAIDRRPRGGDAATNADIARRTLAGEEGPVRDIVLLNAAAGLVSWELAQDAVAGRGGHPRTVPQRHRARRRGRRFGRRDREARRMGGGDEGLTYSLVTRSTQSNDRVTARFHWRMRSSRSAASSSGSQRVSSRQLARSSSRSFQKPTARPAA